MTSDLPYAEVIGDPVEHSKSPLIHNFWLRKLGLSAKYRRARVFPAMFEKYLAERRRDPLWRGCNVTMPLKRDALRLADEPDAAARRAGAANLLRPTAGGLLAENKDIGAILAVLDQLTEGRKPESVTLLGTGGAARAVVAALASLGVRNITIQARDQQAALVLAEQFALTLPVQPLGCCPESHGLINATSLGMAGTAPLRIDLTRMPVGGWVFDLVSVPDPTPLVGDAKARDLVASGGLLMLVEQAATSFSAFFGAEAPRHHDAELMKLLTA